MYITFIVFIINSNYPFCSKKRKGGGEWFRLEKPKYVRCFNFSRVQVFSIEVLFTVIIIKLFDLLCKQMLYVSFAFKPNCIIIMIIDVRTWRGSIETLLSFKGQVLASSPRYAAGSVHVIQFKTYLVNSILSLLVGKSYIER